MEENNNLFFKTNSIIYFELEKFKAEMGTIYLPLCKKGIDLLIANDDIKELLNDEEQPSISINFLNDEIGIKVVDEARFNIIDLNDRLSKEEKDFIVSLGLKLLHKGEYYF